MLFQAATIGNRHAESSAAEHIALLIDLLLQFLIMNSLELTHYHLWSFTPNGLLPKIDQLFSQILIKF